jgi:hypothetical protein
VFTQTTLDGKKSYVVYIELLVAMNRY